MTKIIDLNEIEVKEEYTKEEMVSILKNIKESIENILNSVNEIINNTSNSIINNNHSIPTNFSNEFYENMKKFNDFDNWLKNKKLFNKKFE